MRSNVRQIDHVLVAGSKYPVRVYTVDLHTENLQLQSLAQTEYHRAHTLASRQKLRIKRRMRKIKNLRQDLGIKRIFASDSEISRMRKPFSSDFYSMSRRAAG